MVWLAVPGEFAGRLQVSRGGGGRTGWPVGPGACGRTRVTERVPEQWAGGDPGEAVTAPGTGPCRGASSRERKRDPFVGWREQKGRKGTK